jgi:hypothetical protein
VDVKELGAQGASMREKKRMKSKVSNKCSTRGFKGDMPDSPPSAPGPPCQQDFRPHTLASEKQPPATVMPQFPWDADLQILHVVMMERSRWSCRPRCPRP